MLCPGSSGLDTNGEQAWTKRIRYLILTLNPFVATSSSVAEATYVAGLPGVSSHI